MKAAKAGFEESPDNKSYPIRMTLSSTKMKAVEQGMWAILLVRPAQPPHPLTRR